MRSGGVKKQLPLLVSGFEISGRETHVVHRQGVQTADVRPRVTSRHLHVSEHAY